MDFYFNELSLSAVKEKDEANLILMNFLRLYQVVKARGFDIMHFFQKTPNEIKNFEIAPGYFIFNWLKDSSFDIEYRRKLGSLLHVSQEIEKNDPDLSNLEGFECKVSSSSLKESIGLHVAHIKDSISISLHTDTLWDNHQINVNCYDLNVDYNNPIRLINVRHASNVDNFYLHKDWVLSLNEKSIVSINWDPTIDQFPRKDEAKLLVQNADWNNYYKLFAAMEEKDKQTQAIIMGRKVAEIHGYSYDGEISSRNKTQNSLRYIYAAGIGKDKIYLSVDVRHARFEVCDYKGNAMYECNFDGQKTGRGHQINV